MWEVSRQGDGGWGPDGGGLRRRKVIAVIVRSLSRLFSSPGVLKPLLENHQATNLSSELVHFCATHRQNCGHSIPPHLEACYLGPSQPVSQAL